MKVEIAKPCLKEKLLVCMYIWLMDESWKNVKCISIHVTIIRFEQPKVSKYCSLLFNSIQPNAITGKYKCYIPPPSRGLYVSKKSDSWHISIKSLYG